MHGALITRIWKRPRIVLTTIAVCAGVLVLAFSFQFEIFQGGDNGGYMVLGISLAHGQGYSNPALPHSPHYLWWPPGFPTVIALLYSVFGPRWVVMKLVLFIMFLSAAVRYGAMLYRKEGSLFTAAAVTAAIAFSASIHLISSYLYSELTYLTVTMLLAVVYERWSGRPTPWRIVLLSLWSIVVASIRNIGLVMPIALAVILFVRQRARGPGSARRFWFMLPAVFSVGYVFAISNIDALKVESFHTYFRDSPLRAPASPAPSGVRRQPGPAGVTAAGSRIVSYVKCRGASIVRGLRGYGLTLIPRSLIGTLYDRFTMNRVKAVCMACVTALVIVGWIVTLRGYLFMNIYCLLYGGVLFGYPPLYVRLLVPIVPFLALYLFRGIYCIAHAAVRNGRAATVVIGVCWALVLADNIYGSLSDPHRTMRYKRSDEDYQKGIAWIARNAGEGETVVSALPNHMYVLRGPYSIPFFVTEYPNETISYFDEHRVKYILVGMYHLPMDRPSSRRLFRIFRRFDTRFRCVWKREKAFVLEYLGDRDGQPVVRRKDAGPDS